MSTIKAFTNGTFQLRVSSKLLDKPLYATFDSKEQAEAYGTQLEGLLAQGIVPKSLLERTKTGQEIWNVSLTIALYFGIPAREFRPGTRYQASPHHSALIGDRQHRTSELRLGGGLGSWNEAHSQSVSIHDPTSAWRSGAVLRLDAEKTSRHHGAKSAAVGGVNYLDRSASIILAGEARRF
jgi:hypothetical protein